MEPETGPDAVSEILFAVIVEIAIGSLKTMSIRSDAGTDVVFVGFECGPELALTLGWPVSEPT
jgi:hypothetical protein